MNDAGNAVKKSSTSIDRQHFPVDPWRLVETTIGTDAGLMGTLFCVANGYLGMRADYAPDPQSGGTYVNGLHETFEIEYDENAFAFARTGQALLEAPDTKSVELRIGGDLLRLDPFDQPSTISDYSRTLDFRTGVLTVEFTWHTATGSRIAIAVERLVSLADRHLAAQRISVTALDASTTVEFVSSVVNRQELAAEATGPELHDPRRGRAFTQRVLQPVLRRTSSADDPDATVSLGFRTPRSAMTVVAGYRHHITSHSDVTAATALGDDRAATTFATNVGAGGTVELLKYASYHTSGQIPSVESNPATAERLADACEATLAAAAERGWQQLLDTQQAWLAEFWHRTDVEIGGDEVAQQAVRWNLFQLAQASAQIGERGIAAKAVSAPGYNGHYFWDTEVYVLPLLASTNPKLARQLLAYRHRILPAARRRAIEMSQTGALYPWRTINGEEASSYYPAGTAQYHIDADVAYAIERYVTASGDQQFVADQGAEILVELARLFADLGFYGHEQPPVFHIHGVTGPDEYSAVVDDNLYTNAMARFTLRYAAATVQALEAANPVAFRALVDTTGLATSEVEAWLAAGDAMCILYDAERRVSPQDAAFLGRQPWDWEGTPPEKYPLLLNFHPLVIYRHQVLKQADVVLAMFIRADDFDRDLQRRNFDFYDPLNTGDSSLSACVQSIVAAQVGRPELAWHYFDQSLYLDIADTHGNTADGTHIANVGGVWAALVHGFAGVHDNGLAISVQPRLPVAWTSIRFGLQRCGSQLRIDVDHEGATVSVESGEPVPLDVDGTVQLIAAGGSVHVVPDQYVVGP